MAPFLKDSEVQRGMLETRGKRHGLAVRVRGLRRRVWSFEEFSHRLLSSSSFLWFIFRSLLGNPKKELLRSLWVVIGVGACVL